MTDDHLSLDELAELDEGLLSADRISAIRGHVHGCADCRTKAEAITTARSALADLPPVAMPLDVRRRIDDALDREAEAGEHDDAPPAVELSAVDDPEPRIDDGPQLDSGPAEAPDDRPAGMPDVIPASDALVRGRFGRPTMATSAVAAAIVLAVGAIVVAHFHHGSSAPQASVASGVGSATDDGPFASHGKQPTSVVVSATGTTYTAANLAASVKNVLARSSATGPITAGQANSGAAGVGTSGGSAASPERSTKHPGAGTTANKTTTAPPAATLTETASGPVPKALRPLFASQAKIIACAQSLTGQQDAVPEHVDFGRWTGGTLHRAPSAIFIFQGETPSTVAVWVTNPTCSGNDIIRTVSQVTITN